MQQEFEVIVIGAGPAGISAAIWCQRLHLKVLLIEQEDAVGGQLLKVGNLIWDYPGFLFKEGKDLAQQFHDHIQQLHIPLSLATKVIRIDEQQRLLHTSRGIFGFQYVILATGATEKHLRIPGEEKIQHEQFSTTKDKDKFKGKRVLVVGGGDRAVEGALNIAEVAEQTWLVHRRKEFRARTTLVQALKRQPNIEIFYDSLVKEIIPQGIQKQVQVWKEGKESYLTVDFILVRIGMEPDTDLVKNLKVKSDNGLIHVDHSYRTSIPWLFAIGELVTPSEYRSVSWSVGQGMVAGKAIEREIYRKKE